MSSSGYTLESPPSDFKPAANSGVAAGLNILPGIGNFYLAHQGGGGMQWALGAGNLLLWPFSPLWSVAEGYSDARTLNRRALAAYGELHPCLPPRPANGNPDPTSPLVASPTTPSMQTPELVVDGWTYDADTRRGTVRLRIMGRVDADVARSWARKNIASIVRDKNIALSADTGNFPPSGATFRSLGESLENGILTVEFEAVQ